MGLRARGGCGDGAGSGEPAGALEVRRHGARYSGGGKEGGRREAAGEQRGPRLVLARGQAAGTGEERLAGSRRRTGVRQGKDARAGGQGTRDLEKNT